MPLPASIEDGYIRLSDIIFDHIKQPKPSKERLRLCKIVSHRGAHDNKRVMENTVPAFERSLKAGVWGIELDIRWSKDMEPVVFHDKSLLRLYGSRKKISAFPSGELRRQFPAIPTLKEIVLQFGQKCHLMIEIKIEPWIDRQKQIERLQQILSPLEPRNHYHLMAATPDLLQSFTHVPAAAKAAIAMRLPELMSKWVRQYQWDGLCGHYSLIGKKHITTHHQHAQKLGTGFPRSRNCLFRELNRGIDWIFSDNALQLQRIVNDCLDSK